MAIIPDRLVGKGPDTVLRLKVVAGSPLKEDFARVRLDLLDDAVANLAALGAADYGQIGLADRTEEH